MSVVNFIVSRNLRVQLVESEVDHEIVMLRLDTGMCYGLNKVGAVIWRRLSAPVTVAEICSALMEQYDVDRATCEKQVMELLYDLQADGFVSIAEPAL